MWLSEPHNLLLPHDLRSPPKLPKLEGDDLHLFCFPGCVSDKAAMDAGYLDLLSPEEKERAQGIKSSENFTAFIQSRGYLRWLLGYQLGIPPQEVPLVIGAYGKPLHRFDAIDFNLSHTKDAIVIGIARRTEIGVDVEYPRATRRLDALIREVFSIREQRWFEGLGESERQDLFLRGWTLKEAWVKATGRGIAAGLSRVVIREDFEGFEAIPEGRPSDFQVFESSFLGARIALVHRGGARKILYYRGSFAS